MNPRMVSALYLGEHVAVACGSGRSTSFDLRAKRRVVAGGGHGSEVASDQRIARLGLIRAPVKRGLEHPHPFADVSAVSARESPEMGREAHFHVGLTLNTAGSVERDSSVVVLGFEKVEPHWVAATR